MTQNQQTHTIKGRLTVEYRDVSMLDWLEHSELPEREFLPWFFKEVVVSIHDAEGKELSLDDLTMRHARICVRTVNEGFSGN